MIYLGIFGQVLFPQETKGIYTYFALKFNKWEKGDIL